MKYYVVDAFTKEPFHGNPAGVCLSDHPLDGGLMQSIAAENNLPETAFAVARDSGYDLRWFTPETEIDLCGHATLATGFVIMSIVNPALQSVEFHTQSGSLTVKKRESRYYMDFPSRPPAPCGIPEGLADALGAKVLEAYRSRDLLAVLENERAVRELSPDFEKLKKFEDFFGIIVTAQGSYCDFVSRFFAPGAGILEDPVTGSSHCTLIPFWAARLGEPCMEARQLSKRGGRLNCELRGDRVMIAGDATLYLSGEIHA